MTYLEAVEYIESLSVFGSRPGFQRIEALEKAIGNPEKSLKIIHVAGTNGKGSVCNEVRNILEAAGYRTGLFTSPYVSDFRERIQIGGKFIKKDLLASLTAALKIETEKLEKKGIQPTEFEFLTALAFLAFKEEKVDYVVLETGLGGLLDSTNIIEHPILTAVTSLSLDHIAILGNTIEEIAYQKAGIFKKNVPVVSACNQPKAALKVLKEEAKKKNCPFIIGSTKEITAVSADRKGQTLKVNGNNINLPLYGDHQIINLGVTLGIVEELIKKGIKITPKDLEEGLKRTSLPGRIEVLSEKPLIIIDGGHNAAGVTVLRAALEKMDIKNLTVITGVMKDKETDKMAEIIKPIAKKVITVTPSVPRAMNAYDLKRIFDGKPGNAEVLSIIDPVTAVENVINNLTENESLLISGSLYLAGEVREKLISLIDSRKK